MCPSQDNSIITPVLNLSGHTRGNYHDQDIRPDPKLYYFSSPPTSDAMPLYDQTGTTSFPFFSKNNTSRPVAADCQVLSNTSPAALASCPHDFVLQLSIDAILRSLGADTPLEPFEVAMRLLALSRLGFKWNML
jgi:hypothetical protein